MSTFKSDKSWAEKAKIAPTISFMWNNDAEKVEWMHTMSQLDERGKDFVTSVVFERAETKLKLRHYIDPNFYFGAADCFIYPYNHNPDLNEFKATLQRNIMALKSVIKRIEESKKRKRSASNHPAPQANPTKKVKIVDKQMETAKTQPKPQSPKPQMSQAADQDPVTAAATGEEPITSGAKEKDKSPPPTPETLRKLKLTRFVDPVKQKNKRKPPPSKITLQPVSQSVPQSTSQSPKQKPKSPAKTTKSPAATLTPTATITATSTTTPAVTPTPTSTPAPATPLSDSDSSGIITPTLQTTGEESPQPTVSNPNSPTLDLIPQDICSDIVFADKIKEKIPPDDLKFIGKGEINKKILKDTYDALKQLSIKGEMRMASSYRRRLYNIKRHLKNTAIAEKGKTYLQSLLDYDLKRYYLCSVAKKGSVPAVCSFMTEIKQEMENHIQTKHQKTKKSKANYNPVILYKDEAKDLQRIIQKRDARKK